MTIKVKCLECGKDIVVSQEELPHRLFCRRCLYDMIDKFNLQHCEIDFDTP